MDDDSLAPGTQVGRVRLTVAALAETVPFYRDVVGLTVHDHGDDTALLGGPDAGVLELIEDGDASTRSPTAAGLYHVAIRVPTRAALGAALSRVEGAWRLQGASDHGVSEAIYLADPERNGLEIYCDRPQAEWPAGEGDQVGMVTEPMDREGVLAASDGGESVPVGTDIGHVHLEVTDVDAARAFYVDALGMNLRATYGADAAFVAAGDYHHHVGLNAWHGRSTPADPDALGLAEYELRLPDGDALERTVDRLRNAGIDVEATEAGARIVDPDGIPIALRVGE